jgi:hypothetical protein
MTETAILSIQSIVDLLNRRNPDALTRLQSEYPSYKSALEPGKKLGDESHPSSQMLKDLARMTIAVAKEEGLATSQTIQQRFHISARLRLAGAVVSSLSSGGIIAALTQGSTRAALVSGCIAFGSSCFTLVAQYVEDYSGGQQSLRELRERVATHTTCIWEVEAEFKLMTALNEFSGLEGLVRKLNVAVASIRQAQLAVS